MEIEMRKTGIDVVGDMPWGTHFCLFYETKADLLETLVPYCKAGLENQEFCLWVVAEPLSEEDARNSLKRAVPDFDRYLVDHSIEIVPARDWYLQGGTFDLKRVIGGWNEKLARASVRGFAGVRVTGDTAWLEKKDWKDFCEYEESLNECIANQRLAVLCTYPLAACGGSEILDVVRTHQFAVAKRRGSWDVIETAGHKQAKAEIKRLNNDLEQRVIERTSQLMAVNEELTKEVLERQRAEEALQRSEAYLAEAQTLTHTGSFGWNVSSEELWWSRESFRILGYDLTTKPSVDLVLERIHPEDRAVVGQVTERARQDQKDFDLEHRLLMPDGSVKYLRVAAHAWKRAKSGDLEFVGSMMDITAMKQAEEEIRALSERLLTAQEEERTRIARELHDELNQEIAAVVLSLSRIRPILKEREPRAGEQLEKAGQRLVRLSSSVRDLSHQLYPAILEHSDLGTGLAVTSAEFSSASGVNVSFEASGRFEDVPQAVALCVYRVTQEALQNVAKHAAAMEASVHLDRTPDGVRLTVSDRGIGFDPRHARASGGLGLVSMRERVRLVRGILGVESKPDRGTTLTVEIPLTGPAHGAASTFGGL
jgi:PAS domain S-box-containing protein